MSPRLRDVSSGVLGQGAPAGDAFLWVIVAVVVLATLMFLLAFARVYRLWMRAMLSRAAIPLPQILLMILRKTDAEQIVRLKIMAVQSGVEIPTHELERAYLRGANVERAVLAMVRAKELGENVTWDELMSADVRQRLSDPER